MTGVLWHLQEKKSNISSIVHMIVVKGFYSYLHVKTCTGKCAVEKFGER